MKNRGKEDRKAYGELLLELAKERESLDGQFVMGILGNGRMRRRILEMKKDRKNKMVASIATMLVICMAGQITAFAYEMPIEVHSDEEEEIVTENTEMYFSYEEFEIDGIFSDNYFVDEDGNIYEVENQGARVNCSHSYEAGINKVHTKKSNGGCAVTFYKAKRCVKCGDMEKVERIETRSYDKCPH